MHETFTMSRRSVRLTLREVDGFLTSLILPVMIMLLFVYLFGGAIETPTEQYVDFVLPGVLLMCTGFVSALTATSVTRDMSEGIVDRFRSMGVSGGSVLAGHVVSSLVRCGCASALVLATAFLIGFRSQAGVLAWTGIAGVLAMFVFAVSWLAAVFGLLARTPEGASGFSFAIMFLPYASNGFVPVGSMPGWVQSFAANQPVTPVVDTLRGLLHGTPAGSAAWTAAAWCAGITVVAVVLSVVLFRRRTA
ncbi:multidrug ABC transporter permease [Streptomyces abyssalis]|uniref:Transport permease protein n=1 Tax=Streptomyces abyssalis TaxID=933944 RepID=A0A1E7JV68_9ACTN|nr:ABC transporter permease [Streptomyces abyssalis]OEU89486.1 multidrug ABC transporter permease [Streptomyces abyssalis]OEU93850.1 multidrug ABC transporter permease [Streptomyces abyssalis]OEV04929.1 multidrug ABC transporter permease [Streptomyces nanshensis]